MEIDSDLIEIGIGYATRVGGALLILIIGLVIAGWMARLTMRTCDRRGLDPTLGKFFSNIVRYTFIALTVITALSACGVETTSFAAVLGATGLAVGLALQGSLGNVAAGVMLIIFRPIKVGDFVVISGQSGSVDEISLFAVTLTTPDNRVITIPNGNVFGSVIENVTTRDTRRVQVTVGVEYTADLDETRKVLETAVAGIEQRLDEPASAVVCGSLGASSVDWHCRLWVKTSDFWPATEALTVSIKKHLDAAGIGIPFPQMDVHLQQPENSEKNAA